MRDMRGERGTRKTRSYGETLNLQFSIFNLQSERNGGDVDIGACLLDALSVRLGRCSGEVDL